MTTLATTPNLPPKADAGSPLLRVQLATTLACELAASYAIDNGGSVCRLLSGSTEHYARGAVFRWLMVDAELPERGYLTHSLRRRVDYQFRVVLRLIDRLNVAPPA